MKGKKAKLSMSDSTFGGNIKTLRESHNLTQEELAQKVHCTRQLISHWERNKASPNTDTTIMLCKIFGVSLGYLRGGATPLDHAKTILKYPYEWTQTTSINDCDVYYYNYEPEYTIEYGVSQEILSPGRTRGEFTTITNDRYWMNRLSRARSSDTEYKLRLIHKTTVLKEWTIIHAFSSRFERVLWCTNQLPFTSNNIPISYSYIEEDSIEFALDWWLSNYSKRWYYEDNQKYRTPLEPWRNDPNIIGRFDPYEVVPIFDSDEEHRLFINFVETHRNEFLEGIGDFNRTDNKYALMDCPRYMDFLCNSGEVLVKMLREWRLERSK